MLTQFQLDLIDRLPEDRKQFMNNQKNIEPEGSMLYQDFFMPNNGYCYHCKFDLIKYHTEKGNDGSQLVTGCHGCHKSYCD